MIGRKPLTKWQSRNLAASTAAATASATPIAPSFTAATEVTVPHNFGSHPSVEVYNANGQMLPPTRYNVTCASDHVRVRFTIPTDCVIRVGP